MSEAEVNKLLESNVGAKLLSGDSAEVFRLK